MEIGRRAAPVERIDSGEAWAPPPTARASIGPAVDGSQLAAPVLTPVAEQPAPGCSAPANQENFFKEPGFEQATTRWVQKNRKSSFRRINASELTARGGSPPLESMVMMIKPTPYDGNRYDGPRYITQEINFPSGTRRVRICCDLAYAGDITREENVRLSIYDPNVHYFQGGKTFPFTRGSPLGSRQWRHVEWVVDVSEIGSRRLELGYMFPFSNEPWYIDNTKVTVVAR